MLFFSEASLKGMTIFGLRFGSIDEKLMVIAIFSYLKHDFNMMSRYNLKKKIKIY